MPGKLEHLSPDLRDLMTALRDHLREVLNEDLVGLYLFGSIAFPGFEPHDVDIDFYAIVRRPIAERTKKKLKATYRSLAERYKYGNLLDGLFVTLDQATRREPPVDLQSGSRDDAWALHREHFHQGASIVLHGPNPQQLVPPASWLELREGLDEELRYVETRLSRAPMYCVLNLCRLIYSWETRIVAVSKVAAADWAIAHLPARWKPLIEAALRAYRDHAAAADQQFLRKRVKAFLKYAANRIREASNKADGS